MAIKVNSKGVSHARSLIAAGKINEGAWSFSAADGNALLGDNENWAEYGKWFLAVESEAEENTKGHYKYPFGKRGEIYRRGVIAAKSRAAQQGESAIADAANSLLEAIDKKLGKDAMPLPEIRCVPLQELRVLRAEGQPPKIQGYAALFDVWSVDLGGFREIIRSGAFTKTLKDGADVRALFNHDPNWVLGRTRSGTLTITEDDRGLRIEALPPETQLISDLVLAPMERGDIDQMSFAFRTIRDTWGKEDGKPSRELLEAQLYDVSIVTYPAYEETSAQVARSILRSAGLDETALAAVILRDIHHLETGDEEADLIRHAIEILSAYLPEPEQEPHSEPVRQNYDLMLHEVAKNF